MSIHEAGIDRMRLIHRRKEPSVFSQVVRFIDETGPNRIQMRVLDTLP